MPKQEISTTISKRDFNFLNQKGTGFSFRQELLKEKQARLKELESHVQQTAADLTQENAEMSGFVLGTLEDSAVVKADQLKTMKLEGWRLTQDPDGSYKLVVTADVNEPLLPPVKE